MANTARVTQSFALAGTLQNGSARVTQSYIILGIGLGITCANPPMGQIGTFYSHTFPSGGGEPPLVFSITAGSLPFGLTLDPATGIVSGTPTGGAVFAFTITVTDASFDTASVACSISIKALGARTLSGTRRKTCPPAKLTDLDWSAFSQAVEEARPPDVDEVRVPDFDGMLRTN